MYAAARIDRNQPSTAPPLGFPGFPPLPESCVRGSPNRPESAEHRPATGVPWISTATGILCTLESIRQEFGVRPAPKRLLATVISRAPGASVHLYHPVQLTGIWCTPTATGDPADRNQPSACRQCQSRTTGIWCTPSATGLTWSLYSRRPLLATGISRALVVSAQTKQAGILCTPHAASTGICRAATTRNGNSASTQLTGIWCTPSATGVPADRNQPSAAQIDRNLPSACRLNGLTQPIRTDRNLVYA